MNELPNWNLFKARFDQKEQWAFENMAYFLFCSELDCPIGLFRYKNQPGIETEPIEKDGKTIGFQAKYYKTPLSKNKNDIIDSIDIAKKYHPCLTTILFYIIYNDEGFSKSTKTKSKPKFQIELEQYAQSKKIDIDWRVPSQIEFQLAQPRNKWIKDIFFGNDGLDPDFFDNNIEKSIANLGDRYNAKLNFELPIAKLFDSLARGKVFYDRFIKTIDKWLTDNSYHKLAADNHYHDIETDLETIKDELMAWTKSFHYSVDKPIELDCFLEKIRALNDRITSARNKLFNNKLQNEKGSQQRDIELYRLREIESSNLGFLSQIDGLNINLSNKPIMIIHGEAGCGKSHLLGDVATRRKELSIPTILLLGNNFKDDTIENNILNLLGLSYSFDDFAKNLNEIGLRMESRVLLMIDGINEGPGPNLWKNQIAGFIKVIEKYPAVGLVLTIRTTYYKEIIPDSFKTTSAVTIEEHFGFKGNEYEALRLFCENYGLNLPNFPILNPEYSNPLFLHLICKTLKERHEKTFPTGFNGIRNTLALYLECQNEKFDSKRQEYRHRNIVTKAVEVLAKEIFNAEYERLKIEDAFTVFDANFPGLNNLLADLIEEGILIKHHYQFEENSFEYLVFSYQRIGDFFIAEELLKPYDTFKELQKGFVCDSNLTKIKTDKWEYNGLLEAMAVIIPEKYNHELFEFSKYFIDKSDTDQSFLRWQRENLCREFGILLSDSLKWRSIKSIDSVKITTWLKSQKCLDQDTWLYTLAELSTIPNHPFNSDYLHKLLSNQSMPIRDSFWQQFLLSYKGYNDYNIAYPYRRLVDWAWTPGISSTTDTETVRLAAQTLAWGLASTNNAFRDQTTKAMVNLLEQQPETLISILRAFENVDDPYIIERLYAIAYGCILRTEKDDSITLIARYVYDTIFKNGHPPVHVLLRDYARNIIEYAFYRSLITNVDVSLIRPPYCSSSPVFLDAKEIEKYSIDYDDPEYDKPYSSEQNAIFNSLIDGIADFGHYIVESAIDNFSSVSVLAKAEYDTFYDSSNDKVRELLDNLFEYRSGIIQNKKGKHWITRIGVNFPSSKIDVLENRLSEHCISELQKLLDKTQYDYLQNSVIPYFDSVAEEKELDTWGARNWVVKRVFELGYDRNKHGKYDHLVRNFYNTDDDKTERIGKKYQWIAYHELMARVSDNYCLSDRWEHDSIKCYNGPWQLYLRNIDPVYTKRDTEQKSIDVVDTRKEWWKDDDYSGWNVPDGEWVNTIDDLISPQSVIQKKDDTGSEWLRLSHHATWKEPKRIGEDRYSGKQIWYFVQAFIVDKSDKKEIVTYLTKQNFFGRWLPERHENSYLFSREKYWSPAYKDTVATDDNMWSVIQDTNYMVIIADEEAKVTISGDKSGCNKSYCIPCGLLFEGMDLRYAPMDGDLKNERGETIVINKDENGCLIRKTALLEFLEKNNLDIIWTILGEKLSTYGTMVGAAYCKVPCGVFYLEDGEIVGKLKMYDRE